MGSTNVLRVLGWKWGLVVQIFDIVKGFLAVVILANLLGHGIKIGNGVYFEHITVVKIIAGISAVCGHIWTVFAGFHGGKGINTAAGMLIGIVPIDMGISVGLFVLAVIFSGYISLGSIIAAIGVPSSMFFRYNILKDYIPGYHTLIYFAIGLSVLLLFTHRSNIKRLILGTESRIARYQLIKCGSNKAKT